MTEDTELYQALTEFRRALIEALVDIQVQVAAAEAACLEKKPLTTARLRQLRATANEKRDRYRARFSGEIPLPYVFREPPE